MRLAMNVIVFLLLQCAVVRAQDHAATTAEPTTTATTTTQQAVEIDPASPRGVGLRLVKALSDGDAPAAKSLITQPDELGQTIDALADMSQAMKQLVDKAIAKWGDEAQAITMADPSRRMEQRIRRATEEINGDVALLNDPMVPQPMMLRKVDGVWKIDLTGGGGSEPLVRMAPAFLQSAKLARETADEVDQGKYASPIEMSQAMQQKMVAAMQQQQEREAAPGIPTTTTAPSDGAAQP
jgi:hypothetical protein